MGTKPGVTSEGGPPDTTSWNRRSCAFIGRERAERALCRDRKGLARHLGTALPQDTAGQSRQRTSRPEDSQGPAQTKAQGTGAKKPAEQAERGHQGHRPRTLEVPAPCEAGTKHAQASPRASADPRNRRHHTGHVPCCPKLAAKQSLNSQRKAKPCTEVQSKGSWISLHNLQVGAQRPPLRCPRTKPPTWRVGCSHREVSRPAGRSQEHKGMKSIRCGKGGTAPQAGLCKTAGDPPTKQKGQVGRP